MPTAFSRLEVPYGSVLCHMKSRLQSADPCEGEKSERWVHGHRREGRVMKAVWVIHVSFMANLRGLQDDSDPESVGGRSDLG